MENSKRIDDVLNSLDGVHRAEASPYLFSKIKNRLDERPVVLPGRLAWRLIMALLIIAAMNFYTLKYLRYENTDLNKAGIIASDYNISLPQSY
jgi:hypothetical protein